MAGLRTLLQYTTTSATPINFNQVRVFNTSVNIQENGGCCCLWTVPTGVTWFGIELWGGGGGGAGACCCFGGWPGGSGSYARKIVTGVTAGQQFRICAAGSTGCSQHCCIGCIGYPSYVLRVSDSTIMACASGGSQGRTCCYWWNQCSYQGCAQYECGSYIGTMGICGVTGSGKGSAYCAGNTFQLMPSAPFTYGTNRGTHDGCSGPANGCTGIIYGGNAHFPGGGGASAGIHTSSVVCGAPGAGGMVYIYFPIL